MRVDYYHYDTAGPQISPPILKQMLPADIREQLLEGEKFSYVVAVDACNTSAVHALDEYLKIGEGFDWRRTRRLEVDKSEIPAFSHFFVVPRFYESGGLGLKGDIYFDEVEPTCPFSGCYGGAEARGPFEVLPKALKTLGVGQIRGTWTVGLWLIAPHVKALLDEAKITGLEYEPCVLKGEAEASSFPPAYVGRVIEVGYVGAEHIKEDVKVCPEHRYAASFTSFGERYTREGLHDVDIQMLGGVYSMSDGKLYRWRQPAFVVSHRALELMLKNRVKGLSRMAIHMSEVFLPLVLEDVPAQSACIS